MRKLALFMIGILCVGPYFFADNASNRKYRWPLDIDNGFSSSFQEFRGNHFHAGLDLRTYQKTGYPVYAIADGTVYRIRSVRRGSGHAVFLKHRDGYNSNYFHLEKYAGEIQQVAARLRRSKGTRYFGDYYLKKPIVVKRGDLLAYSGESGAGFPHLHLEIRDDRYHAVNPFPLLDSPRTDANLPVMHSILLRSRGNSLINGEVGEATFKLVGVSGDRSRYETVKPIIVTGAFDLLLNARDIADTGKKVSPYAIEGKIDGQEVFSLSFDRFSWEDNNQLGFVYDMDYSSPSRYYFNLFSQTGYDLERRQLPFADWWLGNADGIHRLELDVRDNFDNSIHGSVDLLKLPVPAVQTSSLRRVSDGFVVNVGQMDAPGCHELRFEMVDIDNKPVGSVILEDFQASGGREFVLGDPSAEAVFLDIYFVRDGISYYRKRTVLDTSSLGSISIVDVSVEPFVNRDSLFLLVKDFPLPAEYVRLQVMRGGETIDVAPEARAGGLYFRFTPPPPGDEGGDLVLSFIVSNGNQEIGKFQKYMKVLLLQDNKALSFDWKEFSAHFERRSVRQPRVLLAEEKNFSSRYPVLSRQISLSPYNFPFLDKVFYRFSVKVEKPRQVGIFKYSYGGKKWRYVATSYHAADHTFSTRRISSGVFALMRDVFPPRIHFDRPSSQSFNHLKSLTVRIEDQGKGVDSLSLKVFLNGKPVDCEYDPDWKHVKIRDFTHKSMGKNVLVVRVEDRAGNQSRNSFKFYLK